MRSALLLVAWLPCLLVVGCFNPDYSGPGGFTCANNGPCPEGQVCLGGVCREEGAPPTDAGPDAAGDAAADGPAADGPALDGPVPDGPAQDKAVSDGPLPDKAISDGPLPDKAISDGPLQPDTLQPDTLTLDTVSPPVCNYNETAAAGVDTGGYAIDLALDKAGVPHIYYLDGFSMPRTSVRLKGLWSSAAVANKKAHKVSAGIDAKNVQHLVYQGSGTTYLPYYTYKTQSGAWSTPVQISTTADLGESLDVAANNNYNFSFALLSRNTIAGSEVSLYKLNGSSGTTLHWTEASSVYEEPRAAVWGKVATSISNNSALWWRLVESSVLTSSKTVQVINYPGSNQGVCPAPVFVDGSGQIHMVDLSSATMLRHTSWAGSGGGSPSYTTTASDAFGCQIDLAVDGKNLPHVVYTKKASSSAKGPLVWRHRSSAGVWSAHATIASVVDTDARIAVDNTHKRVYFAYRGAGANAQTLYLSCRTY